MLAPLWTSPRVPEDETNNDERIQIPTWTFEHDFAFLAPLSVCIMPAVIPVRVTWQFLARDERQAVKGFQYTTLFISALQALEHKSKVEWSKHSFAHC